MPGDEVEVDLIVGVDNVVVRKFHADANDADVPWLPGLGMFQDAHEFAPRITLTPAPSGPPRRDGLTTLIAFEPMTRYEVIVTAPWPVTPNPRYAVRLSPELVRCGIVLEAALPFETGWQLVMRSRRRGTPVSVSAGAVLISAFGTFEPGPLE
jgi:hypothetical protein